uniref:Uncharacterized protein n=1 Tax=Hemiselmis andersenii TaxID=464988 RepID=A0A7S1HFU6_HEMAN|mmetsp:Transcript_57537/g.138982  ORF Transcript_57537/g.138982 Transcript_57537/m.138982 type:complete len:107 (+) Transcript_57537:169-489(+)
MDLMEKKLLSVMRSRELTDQKLIQVERDRDETRAIENAFKGKMKGLYDKRVRELESVQREYEQHMGKHQGAGGGGADAGRAASGPPGPSPGVQRPTTVGGGARRRL